MKIINPSHEILYMPEPSEILQHIERAGRTCYKSEDKITDDSAKGFVERLIKSGHHSPLEHSSISVRFVCDRGVSHELVRHRLAAYSQSSTRYCNYSKGKFGSQITVISPYLWPEKSMEYREWQTSCEDAERHYFNLLRLDASPEWARSVLPNSLATEIVMTCNIREWMHVLRQRCDPAAHPQMREIMVSLRDELQGLLPEMFKYL
jgi:thymidylate synthase (FAD)